MNLKRRCQVTMLPTNKEAGLGNIYKMINKDILWDNDEDFIGKLFININPNVNKSNDKFQAQHLYILSDEKIEEGDYVIDSMGELFGPYENGDIIGKEAKKIIASTDLPLRLPLLSEESIKLLIYYYNREGKMPESVNTHFMSAKAGTVDITIPEDKVYSRADIIHAFTSGHNKAKMGLTHSDALIQYKEEQKL